MLMKTDCATMFLRMMGNYRSECEREIWEVVGERHQIYPVRIADADPAGTLLCPCFLVDRVLPMNVPCIAEGNEGLEG